MRIGNINEMSQNEAKSMVTRTTNYAKADFTRGILDITDIGKDTGYIFDQGRSMQDVIEQAGVLDVQTKQDYMTVVSNTMSEEDYAKMCEDGFVPSNMDSEESVTIMDHIKAVMAESGQIVDGFNDDLDMETLTAITGNIVDAKALETAMKQADIAMTEENAKDIHRAAKEIGEINSISDSSIKYMLLNRMEPTIDNIYRSSFSSTGDSTNHASGYYALNMQGYLAKKADSTDAKSVILEIEKMVEKLNVENIDREKQIEEAQWLVEHGIDVTASNIKQLDKLQSVQLPNNYEEACKKAAFSLENGKAAKEANLSAKYDNIYEEAVDILKKTEAVEDTAVDIVAGSGKTINLKNLWNASTISFDSNIEAQIDGRHTLEEVRLKMTLDVNVAMLKKGIEIDTIPLSRLVDELDKTAQELQKKIWGDDDSSMLDVKTSLFKLTQQAVKEIPYLPAAVIGRIRLEEEYSLTKVHSAGTELKAKYKSANLSYETLMTAPRKDMGDSITKAFRNVDDILNDLGMQLNDSNRKAVRILGYNSMSISVEDINSVKQVSERIERVVNGLTPAKTLELIRKGINPMDMNVDDLANVLDDMSLEESTEKYSKFLYRLEKNNSITDSERSAFIGIYRFVNKLEKTDSASIGALMNSDRDITFRNLLTSMRSSKISFNISIDDDFGFLDQVIQKGVSISDQIDQAFSNKHADREYLEESYREYIDTLSKGAEQAKTLEDLGQPVSADNISAQIALNDVEGNVFKMLKRFAKRTDDAMSDKAKELVDKFEERDNAQEIYKELLDAGKKAVEEIQDQTDSIIDLKQLALCHKQLALLGNLSNQDNYTVPVEINGEMTNINLTVSHDEENRGTVSAKINTEEYGEISAKFVINSDNVSGLLISEKKEGIDRLSKVADSLKNQIDMESDIRVIVGKSTNSSNLLKSNADINNVDTKSLYMLAKRFLVAFSQS